MSKLRWTIAAAATALATGALAQDNSQVPASEAVGPPQLRDFQLPGERTLPARPIETPATAPTPPPTVAPPRPSPSIAQDPPAARPAPREAVPDETAPAPEPPQDNPTSAAPAATAPEPTRPVEPAAGPPPLEQPPVAQPPAERAEGTSPSPLWLLPLAALLALGGWLFAKRRRRIGEEPAAEAELDHVAPEPEPAQPPAAPVFTGTVGITLRPQIDIDLVAESVSAGGEEEAVIEFALLLRNSGNGVARDIRLEAKLFNGDNAGEREIAYYFAAPLTRGRDLAIEPIGPRTERRVGGSVDMPVKDMRPIDAEGRGLFVPIVAVTVIYGWGDGKTGQTSLSYIVGRERAGSDRMAPFTLQSGPRTWTDVGRRQNRLMRVL